MKKVGIIYILLFITLFIGVVIVSSVNLDLNHDGVVNMTDLQILASHYEGKATYNSSFDFNNDSRIDLFDIVKVARDVNLGSGNLSGNVTPYFSDSFENYTNDTTLPLTVTPSGFSWEGVNHKSGDFVVVSSNEAYTGNRSLEFHYGGSSPGQDGWAEQRFLLAQNSTSAPREIWVDFYLRFPNNFVWRYTDLPNDNKFYYIWAENYSSNSNTMVGLEYVYDGSTGMAVPQFATYPNNTGQQHYTDAAMFNPSTVAGTWIHVQAHMRVGDGSTDYGAYDIWIDGTHVVHKNDGEQMLYAPGGNNYWRNGYLMGWANSGFTNNTNFYIDDFKVYTQNPGWNLS